MCAAVWESSDAHGAGREIRTKKKNSNDTATSPRRRDLLKPSDADRMKITWRCRG